MLLIASGVAGVFFGIRTATGPGGNDASAISSACIGAGTVANFVAFRVMRHNASTAAATRSTRSRDENEEKKDEA